MIFLFFVFKWLVKTISDLCLDVVKQLKQCSMECKTRIICKKKKKIEAIYLFGIILSIA